MYDAAKEMLHTYEKLLCELQEMKKVISGTIRISTIYSIGLHELPPFIKKFLHDFPSVNVRVEYRRSNLVYEDIRHKSGDGGRGAVPQRIRQIDDQIDMKTKTIERRIQTVTDQFSRLQGTLSNMQRQGQYLQATLGGAGGGNLVGQLLGG